MKERKSQIIAALVTILIHVGVALLLVLCCMQYPDTDEPEPQPVPPTDITFGGEFVALGDMETPDIQGEPKAEAADEETTADAEETVDQGPQGEGTDLVASNQESVMKTKKKKEGPTKEELEEQAKAKKEQERKESERKKISDKAKNAFKKSDDSGKSGSAGGNSKTGAVKGAPGHTLGAGYTIASWGRPSSGFDGVIKIKVRVNAKGQVVEATYASGTGSAASDRQVRRSCEQASRNSRFSVPKNATGEKTGYIIWQFE